jgi:BirA family biotin operon repressor/biotin-[acetyl-CoA-carboxylase] ligase
VSPALDTLAGAAVEGHLRGRFGEPYLYEPECSSTQLLLAGSDLPEGAVAVTDHQTDGRGRLGRGWQAPPATAVLLSTLLRPPPDRNLPELTLVAALAVAETVEAAAGLSAQIKWPNDVMLNRRKVAGILAEVSDGTVVLGIGLNVNQARDELPSDATTEPGSLRTLTGSTFDRAALVGSLLFRLEQAYDGWLHGGLAALYGEIGARDFLRGRRLAVDGEAATGVMIRPDGRLELVTDAGESRVVESGEVQFQR